MPAADAQRPRAASSYAAAAGHRAAPVADAFVDFSQPVPRLSFGDVEQGDFDPDAVRGKIVMVGATAQALQDVARTPVDERMAGPELHGAGRSARRLDGFPLRLAGRLGRRGCSCCCWPRSRRWSRCASARLRGLIAGILATALFLVGA